MGVLRFKDGCEISGPPSPAQARILGVADSIAQAGPDVWVTCLEDGHGEEDPHTLRKAADIRTHDRAPADVVKMYRLFGAYLGAGWTVLYEAPAPVVEPELRAIWYGPSGATAAHLHIQVKIGETFPPEE
jgi:hypothetical protein